MPLFSYKATRQGGHKGMSGGHGHGGHGHSDYGGSIWGKDSKKVDGGPMPSVGRTGAPKCKNFLRFATCKFGDACRFDHQEAVAEFDNSQQEGHGRIANDLSPTKKHFENLKREAHKRTEQELNIFFEYFSLNGVFGHKELVDILKNALTLCHHPIPASVDSLAESIARAGMHGASSIDFEGFRRIVGLHQQEFCHFLKWHGLFFEFQDKATRTIDKRVLCNLIRKVPCIQQIEKTGILPPGCEAVPHFVRIQTKGLENFATVLIREFEDAASMDKLRFCDFIKIAQSEYRPLFAYISDLNAGADAVFAIWQQNFPPLSPTTTTTTTQQQQPLSPQSAVRKISNNPWNDCVSFLFQRLDKDGNGAIGACEAHKLIRYLHALTLNPSQIITDAECNKWAMDLMSSYSAAYQARGEPRLTEEEFFTFAKDFSAGDRCGVQSLLIRTAIFSKYVKTEGRYTGCISEGKFVDMCHTALCLERKVHPDAQNHAEARAHAQDLWPFLDMNKSGAVEFTEFLMWCSEHSSNVHARSIFNQLCVHELGFLPPPSSVTHTRTHTHTHTHPQMQSIPQTQLTAPQMPTPTPSPTPPSVGYSFSAPSSVGYTFTATGPPPATASGPTAGPANQAPTPPAMHAPKMHISQDLKIALCNNMSAQQREELQEMSPLQQDKVFLSALRREIFASMTPEQQREFQTMNPEQQRETFVALKRNVDRLILNEKAQAKKVEEDHTRVQAAYKRQQQEVLRFPSEWLSGSKEQRQGFLRFMKVTICDLMTDEEYNQYSAGSPQQQKEMMTALCQVRLQLLQQQIQQQQQQQQQQQHYHL